jgi:hypothetical protein
MVGEAAALAACGAFVAGSSSSGLLRYEKDRSRADLPGRQSEEEEPPSYDDGSSSGKSPTSRLSVALRFGELSPRVLYWAIRDARLGKEVTKTFARRLHWRDLAYYHLHCFPTMRTHSIRAHYDSIAWVEPKTEYDRRLKAWQTGTTGYPMVDAGMRELFSTGWMTQSVRMVCASFLVEYLRVSWVDGAAWFADTLCDADSAINSMMWQNAGRSGVDQWNFVLSPENGSQDPSGRYVSRWVPELAKLLQSGCPSSSSSTAASSSSSSSKHSVTLIHQPWKASAEVLRKAGLVLGCKEEEKEKEEATRAAATISGGSGGGGGGGSGGGSGGGCGGGCGGGGTSGPSCSSYYPHRVVVDLAAERRLSVESVLRMRRQHQQHNDSRGYDTISVPVSNNSSGDAATTADSASAGTGAAAAAAAAGEPSSSMSSTTVTSKVFTKEEYRIGRDGSVLQPPPRRNGGSGGGKGKGRGGGGGEKKSSSGVAGRGSGQRKAR